MREEMNSRTMRLLLGAFEVRIPIKEPINSEDILLSRDVVNEVFKSAYDEFIERRTLFDRPIIPHTIISNVKHGSIEFEVLYQIIVNVPWAEMIENTELAVKQGFLILEEIGSVAGGLYALNNVGKWIRDHLKKKEVPLESSEKNVSVDIKSTIEVNVNLFDNKERLSELYKRLYYDDKPLSIATVVTDTEAVSRFFRPTARKKYLFSWDDVPGNDNVRLRDFLIQKFGIYWVKTANIEKTDEGRTINLYFENNFISLKLNDEKTKVILKIDDVRVDEFIAMKENGRLNIYQKNIEGKQYLGGQIIVNDLNLHINGINDPHKLRKGDLLVLNNYSALGMQFNSEPNTVYYSASEENPDIEIQSLVMSSFETKEERQIFRGRLIDSDDLADA